MPNTSLVLLAVLVVLLAVAPTADALDLCRRLSEMNGVNQAFLDALGYGFSSSDEYFCGPQAPLQFMCSCGAAGVCQEQLDPWGRDVGQCACCPLWVWIILAVFVLLLTLSVSMVFYACCLRGKWWFDGYPEPIQPLLPRRGPPVVVPAGMPLPQNLFRGYRISDFVSDPLPEAANETASAGAANATVGGRGGAAAAADSTAAATSQGAAVVVGGQARTTGGGSVVRNRSSTAAARSAATASAAVNGSPTTGSAAVTPVSATTGGGATRRSHGGNQPFTSTDSSRNNSGEGSRGGPPSASSPVVRTHALSSPLRMARSASGDLPAAAARESQEEVARDPCNIDMNLL